MKHSRFFLAVLVLVVFVLCTAIGLAKAFKARHTSEPKTFGVSFSEKYAQELGLDWQKAYSDTVQDLGIRKIRLMSYWDRHETQPNSYDFRDLDWMIEKAAQHNVVVTLAIGLRQPRWPECHRPEWVTELQPAQADKELLEYIAVVVNRYKDKSNLESWQLENEASNELFGICPEYDDQMYRREFDLVRGLDSAHALITNVSNQVGVPFKGPVGDKVGFSIYNHATPIVLSHPIHWTYWYVPPIWHGLRAALTESLTSGEAFVHELQAEPWGEVATPQLSTDEQYELMDPEQLKDNVSLALDAGFKEVYLWGAEWWYWRKEKFNDPIMWQTAQAIINKAN